MPVQSIIGQSATRPTPPLSRLALAVALTLVTWEERHRSRGAIRKLERHLLIDIGLDPETARHEAAKPFWRA